MNDGTEAGRVRSAADAIQPPKYHTEGAPRPLTPEGRRRLDSLLAVPPPPEGWPVLHNDALYGTAGLVVNTLDQYTEADPAALLIDLLTAFGNAAGPSISQRADGATHPGKLFAVVVGDTSKSRKGTARANIRRIMDQAAPRWAADLNVGGLSSGEGLISELAEGEEDPRRFVFEAEFVRPLTAARRRDSTLSPVMRQAWDGEPLRVMTRKAPLVVQNHHVSVLAHVTEDELVQSLDATEMANGFGNRFLFVSARRSKIRPEGGSAPDQVVASLARAVAGALEDIAGLVIVGRTEDATELWKAIYLAESKALPGLTGALTARAEAQILRLSNIYAALDGSAFITTDHLKAAKAVWDYCKASVRRIFGSRSGDPVADRLFRAIEQAGPEGLTGTQRRDLFARHASGERLKAALKLLEGLRLVVTCIEGTRGPNRRTSYLPRYAPCDPSD